MHGFLRLTLVALGMCALAPVARADDESDRAAAERLSAIAHDQAVLDGNTRVAVIAGLIVGGAVATAIGVPLMVDALSHPSPLTTDEEGELIGGVVLTSVGVGALLGWPFGFLHTPAERLDDRLRSLATLPPHDRVARAEAIFAEAASEERSTRRNSAIMSFVLAGINAAIVPLDVITDNRWLAGLNGFAAVVGIIGGAIQLSTAGPIERTWRTWLVGTGRSAKIQWTPIVTPTGGGFALRF